MKIALATIQTPFIHGGGEHHIEGLKRAIVEAGHAVESVSMPFRFAPVEQVQRSMEIWATEDFRLLNGHEPDRVICLQFPAYYVAHPRKVLWLMHQYRAVYDLWETPLNEDFRRHQDADTLRELITKTDRNYLGAIPKRYANSRTVANRLQRYNGLDATPLYHPPPLAEHLFCAPAEPYIFAPGRFEEAKRIDLLLRALSHIKSNIIAVIAGDGGQKVRLQQLSEELGIGDRVKFVGRVSEREKLGLYAHSLAVFFGPFNEDLGYVTLEAMLASKPVITCTDSGGPLEFVVHNDTGLVVEPAPEQIAQAIDRLNSDCNLAERMGSAGRENYLRQNISWSNVVSHLLE